MIREEKKGERRKKGEKEKKEEIKNGKKKR